MPTNVIYNVGSNVDSNVAYNVSAVSCLGQGFYYSRAGGVPTKRRKAAEGLSVLGGWASGCIAA
jgi:hypothetical protein